MRETTAASEVLKRLFDRLELVPSDAVEQIEHGAKALGVTQSMGLADSRETLNAAVTRLRRACHDLQRAMFLLAVTEGESRAEIARIWRISRQLVSRMVREQR
jgi:DNA-directed RNA polymerase specialized sigma24 family protein